MPSRADWFEYIHSHMYDMVMRHINEYKGTRDEFGNTGLMCAVLNNDVHMVRLLAEYEAGIISIVGKTALHLAISTKSSEICYILAPYEWNTTDFKGKTALMIAAEQGTLDIVIVLAPYFGTERDVMGFSALDIAIVKNKRDIIEFLLSSQNITVNDLQIAMTIAKSYGHLQVVSILDKRIRECLSAKCEKCKSLTAYTNCQANLISYLRRLIDALYRGQRIDMTAGCAVSTSPSILKTGPGVSPSRQETNSILSIAPLAPQYETPDRSSSSLVPINNPNVSLDFGPSFMQPQLPQYSISAPPLLQAPQTLCIPNFQDLAMNFELLSANYAQLKERQGHKGTSSAAISTSYNNNVFTCKAKGILGGDDGPDSNTLESYSPTPITPTGKRKSLISVSPRSNRLNKKKYMELNAAPLVVDMDDCTTSLIKDSVLPDTPHQQYVLDLKEAAQHNVGSHMERHAIQLDAKDNAFQVHQRQDIPIIQNEPNLPSEETNLMRAAKENNLILARSVLTKESRLCLPDGTTALMIAIKNRSLELAYLLSSNEMRMQDNEGKTALHYAAETDWVDGFKALYYQERDIKNFSGQTAAETAEKYNSVNVLSYIKEISQKGNRNTPSPPKPTTPLSIPKPDGAKAPETNVKDVRTAPKSRRIEDIINFYKAEANQQRVLRTPTNIQPSSNGNTSPSDAPIPPSVSLSKYDLPSPQIEKTSPRHTPSDPPTNPEHSLLPRSNLLVRVGSNLRGPSNIALAPKYSSTNSGPDDAESISQRTDVVTKERTRAPMRSRNNSANIKNHSPLASGKSELMICVENNDFEAAKDFIATQCGRGDRTGNTALMYAAKYNRSDFATALVKYEAGFVNDNDQTAYEIAMSLNNYIVAGILRPHEKDLQKRSPECRHALKNSDLGMQARTVIIEESDSVFSCIPISANSSINEEILHVPQKLKRHTNSTQDLTVEMLLTQNTNNPPINSEPCVNNSPISPPVVNPRGTSENNPLIESVKCGDLAGVKKYLQDCAAMVDTAGMSALMHAAKLGSADAVMVLRSTEAKIRVPQYPLQKFYDLHNGTALMIAAANKQSECVRALIPYEGGLTDDNGLTALMIAARYAYTGIVTSLIAKEAGFLNSSGETALMIAVQNNQGSSHLETIKALYKVEKRRADKTGVTALIWAAFSGQTEVVKLLMDEAGMATNAKHTNGAGFTAIMAAAQVGATAIVELLFPIEGNMVQADGKTVKDWAKNKGVKDLLNMIL